MALRVRKQRVLLNGGKHEGASPLALVPLFNAEGSKNMRLVKPGIVRMVNGFASLNSTAVTTDTGASATRCTGLYHYLSRSSGAITRRDVAVFDDGVNEVELWDSDDGGATWTFLKDLGSGAVGLVPSFLQVENQLFITFGGSIAVQEYDGSSVSDAGQTQPNTPTVTTLGAGNLTGTFQYKVAVIDSNGDVGPASDASSPKTKDQKELRVTFSAAGGSNLGIRIFRTTGDGNFFFFLADVEGVSATTYDDNTDDRTLLSRGKGSANHGEAPPTGARFGMQHRARAIYLGTNANPNRFFYSDLGRGDTVTTGQFERVGEGEEGDYLVTGFPEYEGVAVLFKEHSIWTLSGDGRQTYSLDRSMAQAGTVGKNSVALVPGGGKFRDTTGELNTISKPVIAYLTPHGDARIFDGIADTIISNAAQDVFATMSYEHRDQAWVQIYPPYNWIIFAIPTADQTFSYIALDYTQGTWHPVDFLPNAACAAISESSTVSNILLAGQSKTSVGGTVYQFFTGTDADGSNITATMRTVPLHYGDPLSIKRLAAVGSIFEAQASSLTVTLNIYEGMADTGASAFSTKSLELQASNADFTELDPEQAKDSNGDYPRAKAHVLEWTRTGSTIWGMAGWTSHFQEESQPYAIAS